MREVSRRSFHFIAKNADEAVPFSAGEPRVREEQRLTHREVDRLAHDGTTEAAAKAKHRSGRAGSYLARGDPVDRGRSVPAPACATPCGSPQPPCRVTREVWAERRDHPSE